MTPMSVRQGVCALVIVASIGCRPSAAPSSEPATVQPAAVEEETPAPEPELQRICGGEPLTVSFFDAGQALSALVALPDGRKILVDAGEDPARAGCGAPCRTWHERVVTELSADLAGDELDMVWITHQHSDHHGGLQGIASGVKIHHYVDNGTVPSKAGVRKARDAAKRAGAELSVVAPGSTSVPLDRSAEIRFEAVVPPQWPVKCDKDPNDCSIGLLVTYCDSTILFVGDAEESCEAAWTVGDIDLLQVGHHGSDTSSTDAFISRVKPDYAVISTAPRGEGTNRTYCHPRKSTVERLAAATGGAGTGMVVAFDAERSCTKGTAENWDTTPTSDRLWITARDGTVRLQTRGDGRFERVGAPPRSAVPPAETVEPVVEGAVDAVQVRTVGLSDTEIRKLLVEESIAGYDGNCPCPYHAMSNGRRCGGRSAYSRGGGEAPICYAKDVTSEMIEEYRSAVER